ncbi:3-hydroxyacyl-CoA dehydrogenase/enoyl-CoA hydratase family protein [Marinoscillum sp. MHG1-6]|uniref:3-hydroxyacyl-CoA dehydrogenase/enoyl-CoA hydratase family protein n=1 Tax=Marinoscillum sp. MHG1-6 TaxID=2959627 RepID=UPI002157E2EF|nr:3-hydroxyacyl-CoA dehydrogenase NAD-binding domain-containing protein [Marinoscillum sp. MHG1-6]
MKRKIRKVAVLGSGIMGSRIACHFANIGLEVLLLDISPKELNDSEKEKGLSLDSTLVKNKFVNEALTQTLKAKPAALYDPSSASLIQTGNFDDDLARIKEVDWVLEAIVENLEIKKSLFAQVEEFRKPGTLISSNTSGIPIHLMIQGRSEDFQKHFCGTHFFNPPRYLRLLEIIPTTKTDKDVIDFFMRYGDLYLGKETVLCKDTPAFIANRIGIYAIMSGMHTIEKMGLSVNEVDKLTGPVIGRQKSATFRTLDVVGLDTAVKVAQGLYEGLPKDESRDVFKLPTIIQELYDRKWWGDKTKQGYYKKVVEDGKKEILELDLKTFEYKKKEKIKLDILDSTKNEENLKKRLQLAIASSGREGDFYRHSFFDLFRYCTFRIPEIADELYRIDQAVAAGFGWELGPFATWDAMGVENCLTKMKELDFAPAQWVEEMIQDGNTSFYKYEKGQKCFYDIPSKTYKPIPGTEGFIFLDAFKENKVVWSNAGTTIYDIGDGVLNVEFHTKMNSIGGEVIEGVNTAINMAEKDFRGVVIGNESANFSAGANLAMLFMFAVDQEFDEIDLMIRQFQSTMTRARFSTIPVVAAPSGMALGGGCELSLHCDAIQAHAETYIGLVEFGVGLIPGGGGTKEMTLRAADQYRPSNDPEFNTLQDYFMNIATAKVATSAEEARGMDILKASDRITLNRNRLLAEAKQRVIELAEAGYTQPAMRQDIKVQGRAGMAMFEAGIAGMQYGSYISEHDAKIAKKLSWVMNGGELSAPALVSEQYLLDLEREAFLSLCGEQKTLERIQSILFQGKPLRN